MTKESQQDLQIERKNKMQREFKMGLIRIQIRQKLVIQLKNSGLDPGKNRKPATQQWIYNPLKQKEVPHYSMYVNSASLRLVKTN